MANFPEAGEFAVPATPADYTRQNFVDDIEAFLAATRQLAGANSVVELTISGGVILPYRGSHTVDTESNAASDDLTHMQTSTLPDGSIVILQPADSSRVVTVKNLAGGSGEFNLASGDDYAFDEHSCLVIQRIGEQWREVARSSAESFSREDEQDANITALAWIDYQLTGGAAGVACYGTQGLNRFKVAATSPAGMTVTMAAGAAWYDSTTFVYKTTSQTSSAMLAPSANERIDTVVMDTVTEVMEIHTGVESSTPTAPAIETGEVLIAWIHHLVGETAIEDAATSSNGYIEDKRTLINA